MRTLLGVLLVVVALLATACSDDPSGGERALPTPRPAPDLPGRVIDGGPSRTDAVAIIGLAAGETLTMRALPGIDQPGIREIPAAAADVRGLGQAFESEDGRVWWFVNWGGRQGWIEPGAAFVGAVGDVSVTIAGQLDRSTWSSSEELVDAVAAQFGNGPALTVATEIAADGATTTTVDLFGNAEPGVTGSRLRVVTFTDAGAWRLRSVSREPLCSFGVTESGSCEAS